ncbi:late embryogenesis abundant protein At1g64065-like [Phalaenopsis equestris]|uniref:late embryogenesis abundant protein At1g64065-like n=1 Tax=Phalaenopsis equestris TaxID=78828 RepID=UPI0009E296F5|nr:late embryogenesis abundant protein At1g64065-like [Phalaenopsis equestris]
MDTSNKEQEAPLAHLSPPIHHPISFIHDEESTLNTNPPPPPPRRCVLWCGGCCGATLVLLGVTILVLALTVFKIKDPELTMNNLRVNRLFVPGVGTIEDPTLSVNATLTADISIKNPNVASFRFENSTTDFFYGGETVGVAYAPDGNVRAYRTARMNVTVDVLADRVVLDTNATGSVLFDGEVNMSSYTDIGGRVNVMGVYKLNMHILLNCSFTLQVFSKNITNQLCSAHVQ